ncbi:MAG: CMP deaminase [Mycoplasmataceae bacterium]|nr:CMP deaminase [Mycoplasmataceae bacterium]
MMTLTKWDYRFIDVARLISTWSKDPSTQIGAVIVGNKSQIISQGYNGFFRGDLDETKENYLDREVKYKRIIHAESNAIYNALHNGAQIKGATIYVYGLPTCHECAKAIIQCGIKKVVCPSIEPNSRWEDSCSTALSFFEMAGVEVVFYD